MAPPTEPFRASGSKHRQSRVRRPNLIEDAVGQSWERRGGRSPRSPRRAPPTAPADHAAGRRSCAASVSLALMRDASGSTLSKATTAFVRCQAEADKLSPVLPDAGVGAPAWGVDEGR